MQQLIGNNNSKNKLNLLDHHPILKNKRFKGCFIPPFIPSSQLLPHLLFYDPREAYFCGEMPLQRHEKLNQRFSCYILLFLWYLLPFLLVQQCTTRFYEMKPKSDIWTIWRNFGLMKKGRRKLKMICTCLNTAFLHAPFLFFQAVNLKTSLFKIHIQITQHQNK